MAGGPTTPQLVTAAAAAGGMGFLAAGYQSVDALRADIDSVRSAGTEVFGVNLFITLYDDARHATTDAEIDEFHRTLEQIASEAGLDGPAPASFTDNDYAGKVEFLCEHPVPMVSFTFGLPGQDVVDRLHAAGTEIAVMVTSAGDARAATQRGADVIIAQGTQAGGHQSTFSISDAPGNTSTIDLVEAIKKEDGDAVVVATGGIHTAADAQNAFDSGAAAVQIGTAVLNTPEAGTSAAHRHGLLNHFAEGARSQTEFTRGFSGRPARSVSNEFVRATQEAPAAYPFNNQMTKPLRASAAKKDPAVGSDFVALWCGQSVSGARKAPSGLDAGESLEQVFNNICPAETGNL